MPRVKRAAPRNSVNDRPSGWRLALRRQRRLLRPAGWIALAGAVGLSGMFVIHAAGSHAGPNGSLTSMRERLGALTAASGLRVADVIIEGRANTPEPILRAAIGINKGDPILGFSLEETRTRVETIPWVEHATVERRLPGTIVISLQERRPFAVWQNQGKFVLVDRAAIGINKGDPILGFSLEETRTRVETIPWVEHATVERRLPGTIVISLQERRPFAVWQNQGKFVLVDRAGQVVADQDVSQFRHLPLIVGVGAPDAAAELLDALQQRPALAEKVVAYVRVGERRWNLRMANGTDVMLPEGHAVAALDRLMQLQQDHDVLARPLAAIDMRLPDRLVFRPKAEMKDNLVLPPQPPASNAPTVPVIAKKPT